MKVKCVKNISEKDAYPVLVLPLNPNMDLSNNNFINSSEWNSIDAQFVGYSISVGQLYDVYAVFIMNNTVRYLIFDDQSEPKFYSSELFECIDHTLPFDCHLHSFCGKNLNFMIIGQKDFESYGFVADFIGSKEYTILSLIEYRDCLNKWGFS